MMDGVMYALYMAPDRTIGYFVGDVLGSYDSDFDLWIAGGDIEAFPIEPMPNPSATPADFRSLVRTEFSDDTVFLGSFGGGSGFINGGVDGVRYYSILPDDRWG